jgi:hypothetical protein
MCHSSSSEGLGEDTESDDDDEHLVKPVAAFDGACQRWKFMEYLRADRIKEFLEKHETTVIEAQAVILFRRPNAFVALMALVNGYFFVYRWARLSFYPLILCVVAHVLILREVFPALWRFSKDFLFNGRLDKGKPKEMNRIRTVDELTPIICSVLEPITAILRIASRISADKSAIGLMVYAALLGGLFLITAAVDFFWIIVFLVNAALILPGFSTHPSISGLWA